jgi:DNA polymerase-3 subunit beta
MEAIMQTKKLKQHLDILKLATCYRVIQPILANVAINGRLITTNLDTWIIVNEILDLNVTGITASVSGLEKLAKNVKVDDITFGQDEDLLVAKAGSLTTRMKGIEIEKFPAVPENKIDYEVEIPFSVFLDVIRRMKVSCASYDVNNVLGGIYFNFTTEGLEVASTDGSRLGRYKLPEINLGFKVSCLIPGGILASIYGKMKKEKFETLKLAFGQDRDDSPYAVLSVGEYTFMLRQIDGCYPVYNQLIPDRERLQYQFLMDKKALQDALQAISPFINERTRIVRMFFDDKGILSISGSVPDVGDSTVTLGYKKDNEDETELLIAFNCHYVQDALENIESEIIRLSVDGDLRPAIMTGEKDKADYLYLLMPVQIK